MIPFSRETLKALMEIRQNPGVTVYLPVLRVGADTRPSQVRLRTLARKAEEILKGQNWRQPLIDKIMDPVLELADDASFWDDRQQGLAIFAGENGMTPQLLPYPVEEALYVSDRFYTRPLIPLLTHDGDYYLLALGLSGAKVYLGSRHSLEPLEIEGLPDSLQEISASYNVEKQIGLHSGAAASGTGAVFHGFDNMKDIEKTRIDEYFRQIDASLRRAFSAAAASPAASAAPAKPLIVACVDYLFPLYKQASRYQMLNDRHISGSPEAIPADTMIRSAWSIIQPLHEQAQEKAWAGALNLLGSTKVSVNIRQIIAAASHGRVESLFLPSGRQVPGSYDPTSEKAVRLRDDEGAALTESADLLDVAAAAVLLKGGSVYETNPDMLPADADALAVMRY